MSEFKLRWDAGLAHCSVTLQEGRLEWFEEIYPMDDDRGNGSQVVRHQTVQELAEDGPAVRMEAELVQQLAERMGMLESDWLKADGWVRTPGPLDPSWVNQRIYGQNLFAHACGQRNLAAAFALLKAGLDPLARCRKWAEGDALNEACCQAPDATWIPLLDRLLAAGCRMDSLGMYGYPLLLQVLNTSPPAAPEVVRWLLDHGCAANFQASNGVTPVFREIFGAQREQVVTWLLEAGGDPNLPDKNGHAPIFSLLSSRAANRLELLKILLEHGANPNLLTRDKTPLVYARSFRNPQEVLDLLIQFGAV